MVNDKGVTNWSCGALYYGIFCIFIYHPIQYIVLNGVENSKTKNKLKPAGHEMRIIKVFILDASYIGFHTASSTAELKKEFPSHIAPAGHLLQVTAFLISAMDEVVL